LKILNVIVDIKAKRHQESNWEYILYIISAHKILMMAKKL